LVLLTSFRFFQTQKYTYSTNTAYELVVAGCIKQHGRDWLMQPLVAAFCDMFRAQRRDDAIRALDESEKKPSAREKNSTAGHRVRLHSIELWQDGKLVAGELGFTVGGIYTSQTGFRTGTGTGSIQLFVLGQLLLERGCKLWDFGMEMEYKTDLGASTIPRAEWQKQARAAAATDDILLLDQLDRTKNASFKKEPEPKAIATVAESTDAASTTQTSKSS
jgi:Leu/Phe-tRNA-protein transferase